MNGTALARHLLSAGLILVFVCLPALLAGASLDAPAAPGELRRAIAGALPANVETPDSVLARLFYGGATGELQAEPATDGERQQLLTQARLIQIAFVLGIAMLGYLAVVQAFGRGRALLTCLFLLVLPPIALEGHVLRPETPAALFGGLQLFFLQGIPALLRPASRRGPLRRAVVVLLLAAMAALATGLATAALPMAGVYLLVGGTTMTAAGAQLGYRLLRALPRRRWPRAPLRAITHRLWPWVAVGVSSLLAAMVLTAASFPAGTGTLAATVSSVALLPESPAWRWPLQLLLWVGALALVFRVGLRFGRRGRIGPEFLLGLHCAVLLLHRGLRGDDADALMACVPAAFVLAEGLVATVVLGALFWQRRRR